MSPVASPSQLGCGVQGHPGGGSRLPKARKAHCSIATRHRGIFRQHSSADRTAPDAESLVGAIVAFVSAASDSVPTATCRNDPSSSIPTVKQ